MRQFLEPGSVSVVVTSPPYNIGARYQTYEDAKPREEYLQWIGRVAGEVQRVLEPAGSFFLNVGGTPVDPWIPWDVANRLREQFALQNVIHWVKSIAIEQRAGGEHDGVNTDFAVGHYKPITSPRFLHDCHEYIFHFSLTGAVTLDRLAIGVPYMDKTNIGRWKTADKDLRCRGNTWFIPYKTIRSRDSQRPHPATFPKQLAEMCIKLHGVTKTKLVLDPFVGLGSTAVAAQGLGLPCVGFDVDQTYLDIAKSRLTGWLEDDAALGVQLPLGEAE
jgi:site-specific DNA-methyltransferase (adenine-specific)